MTETAEQKLAREQAEIEYYKANEEQDQLIERGIKLLSTKVLDLIVLCQQNGLDINSQTEYSLLPHPKWRNSIQSVYDELQSWELEHVGEEQFTKSFKLFIDNLHQISETQAPQPPDIKDTQEVVKHKKQGQMAGGSLYNHQGYDVDAHLPHKMFDLPSEDRRYYKGGSPVKIKFNTVSDIYLEQYKVARMKGYQSQSSSNMPTNKRQGAIVDSYSQNGNSQYSFKKNPNSTKLKPINPYRSQD